MHVNTSLHRLPAGPVEMPPEEDDGTKTDPDAGLMWTRETCGIALDWFAALAWVDALNTVRFLNYSDWRLPNACELDALRRRFPADFPPGAAQIRIFALGRGGNDLTHQALQRVATHDTAPMSHPESGTEAVRTLPGHLRSPARGDCDGLVPGVTDPGLRTGLEDGGLRLVRVYDRIPLVRDADL